MKHINHNIALRKVFLIADSALQIQNIEFVLSYGLLVNVTDDMITNLPDASFRITHEWNRNIPSQAIIEIKAGFPMIVLPRKHLILTMVILEEFLKKSYEVVFEQGDNQVIGGDCSKTVIRNRTGLKAFLEWGFWHILQSHHSCQPMRNRAKHICLVLDEARRSRNCIIHNNGLYNYSYKKDVIKIAGESPLIRPPISGAVPQDSPVIYDFDDYFEAYLCSVEFCHLLYCRLRNYYFHEPEDFDYREEGARSNPMSYLLGTDRYRQIIRDEGGNYILKEEKP
jgi:hypothetical protein